MLTNLLASRAVRLTTARGIAGASSYFTKLPMAPPDKIFSLNEGFKADARPKKVNLGLGAYRDDDGKPFVLTAVRTAEKALAEMNLDHEYSTMAGVQTFIDRAMEFVYGKDSPALAQKRIAAIQTLSGTGACRVAAEFIATFLGRGTKIYLPNLTWPNHFNIMNNAGLKPLTYRYYDSSKNALDFEGLVQDLETAEQGSVFLLHACAHNPTGCDPTRAQWDELVKIISKKDHLIVMDMAYQGFASGNAEADAYPVRLLASKPIPFLVAQSFAKNFGLYGERIGTLSAVVSNPSEAVIVKSQLQTIGRAMYSNPPIYGARIINHILSDKQLFDQWTSECKGMADRIASMRLALRTRLSQLTTRDWSHITSQIGMFCYTGLNTEQVERLKEEFAIYCTGDGRISMSGINTKNLEYLANSIATVVNTK